LDRRLVKQFTVTANLGSQQNLIPDGITCTPKKRRTSVLF